jgi:hypothetical protein
VLVVTGFRITSITAYTIIGEDDEEGICGFLGADGTWMPMIAADAQRLSQLRQMAQLVANTSGQPVRVRRFEAPVEVETLEPRT